MKYWTASDWREVKNSAFSMVTGDVWKRVKRGMEHKLGIDVPGMGISFLVPVSSIGGKKALQLMLAGQEFEKRRRHH